MYLHVVLEVVAVLPRTYVSYSGMRLDSSHHSDGLKLQDEDDVEIDLQDENSFDQDSTSNRLKEHYCCSLVYLRIAIDLIKRSTKMRYNNQDCYDVKLYRSSIINLKM